MRVERIRGVVAGLLALVLSLVRLRRRAREA